MTLTLQQAIDIIYSFTNYELTDPAAIPDDAWNLDNIRRLVSLMDNPHLAYPTIHVAGTKGKGSTAAFITQGLIESGLKTGLYVSPHLQDFRERVQVNRSWIDTAAFTRLVEDVEPLARQVPGLTWFEVLTALAFWHFAREQVEAAVIEVGLGGRLDATNVVQPIVVVITNISIDHTQLLGDTLAEIAAEKAAIIKPGVPVVSAPQVPEVQAVIERVAAGQDSPLILVGRDWFIRPGTLSVDGSLASIGTNGHMVDYHISLPGMVQVDNAAVALAALEQTRLAGLPITEQSGDLALSNTQWPGRLEVISHTPLILLDSAHNQHSAIQLRLALQTLTAGRSLTLIFGCMGDKDIDGMLRALLPVANRVILTQARHPRAAHPLDLLARAQAIRLEAAHLNQEWAEDLHLLFAPEVARAVVRAQAEMSSEDALCVAGSLAVAGEARTALLGKPEATPTT